ncbi:flagellar basal body rod protein FlgC [Azospirillum sp. sgz302134]
MSGSLSIAASGMMAQTRRIEASASNTANALTKGALPDSAGNVPAGKPGAYQPLDVVQTEQRAGAEGAGTRAVFKPITPAYLPEYEPDASFANDQGMVAAPNVDPARERVNQIAASRAYQANLSVVRTQDDMLKSLLDSKV